MSKILIFAEQRNGKFHPAVFQMISATKSIDSGVEISACIIGKDISGMADELGKFGIGKVLVADDAKFELYRPQPYAKAIVSAIEKATPQIVLMPTTFMSRDLAPRVAAKTKAALATDCTELKIEGDSLIVKRPVYAGKATAEIKLAADRLKIATVRPNSYTPAESTGGRAATEALSVSLDGEDEKLVANETVSTSSGAKDVTEADIIVSGGRPLKSEDNFKMLHDLAALLDAAVGASRAACDAGYQPHSRQVGLTGKTVTPVLYLAFGIDGAIQHLAGMRGSKCIVAINTKKEAPIFSVADYGCVADLFTMAPLIAEEIKKQLK